MIHLDFRFQTYGDFASEAVFVNAFVEMYLSRLCETAGKPVVLMIDEADSVTDTQIFLDFLALLREYYLQGRFQKELDNKISAAGSGYWK